MAILLHPGFLKQIFAYLFTIGLLGVLMASAASGQWTNRYPKVEGFGHHVYLEGYEFPILSSGPVDPAASPDGRHLAFAAYGWIWVLDLDSGRAERVTTGAEVDSRPRWSPDGSRLVFIRDNDHDTSIIVLDLEAGEGPVINTPTIELDPEFSPDGQSIYYTSGVNGTLDIWRYRLATGLSEQITSLAGVERNPRFLADGTSMVYLHAAGFSMKHLRVRSFTEGSDKIIRTTSIAGLAEADTHPIERAIVFAWPEETTWRILTSGIDAPDHANELARGNGLPQSPVWSADGDIVFFVEVDEHQQFHLMQVPAMGGVAKRLEITEWDWGQTRARLRIRTTLNGVETAARLHVADASGHPLTSPNGGTYFDPQNGLNYFYTDGDMELDVPAGDITVTAVRGLMSKPVTLTVEAADLLGTIDIELDPLWDAAESGYYSADFHFHLNYDGTLHLKTADLAPLVEGENLDVATPLSANLHNRRQDTRFEGEEMWTDGSKLIKFGQEVRSHFHGHVGLIGVPEFYYPWRWGPGYPVYGNTDLSNSTVLAFAKERGGIGTYVHPVATFGDPFAVEGTPGIPLEVIADGVHGDLHGLEIVCAWTDEMGTSELWYRFLNLGMPVLAMAGTDMFADFHRTPAVGSARVYVDLDGAELGWDNYLARLRGGHSFVTNAPALEFSVDGEGPGGVVTGTGPTPWSLSLTSAIAVEQLEILVNGKVVWQSEGIGAGEARDYSGTIDVPEGGWIAARAHGGETSWPAMDSYPFAHTSPIWIGALGSTEPGALASAKADLLRALNNAEARALAAYGETDISTFLERTRTAREILEK